MTPEGLRIVSSRGSVPDTLARLEHALQTRGITVFARIDHAAGASAAGLSLRPTQLVIFGNPKVGTPLMQSAQTIGIDLPLHVLVWEEGSGRASIGYNEPAWLAGRHGVDRSLPEIATMTQLLRTLVTEASGL
jgi:uncharacterized protein (DUF302 family)